MSDFGRSKTALEITRELDLSGKTAMITGGSSGIGTETARALAAAGAELILPTRDLEFGSALADRLIADTGNAKIRNYEMDLSDFDSVRRFAHSFTMEYQQLDILINNAGVMACPPMHCPQGFELQFSVNHLGHFLLTTCLAPALMASPACRVVSLSSVAHQVSPVVFDDLHFEQRDYDKWLAYGQSKSANALFALELNQRLELHGGRAYAVNPGSVMTNLQRHLHRREMQELGWMDRKGNIRKFFRSPAQGAATTVWAATSTPLVDHGGAYCENCGIAEPARDGDLRGGVASHARDPEAAARLWSVSEQLVGQPFCFKPLSSPVSPLRGGTGKMAFFAAPFRGSHHLPR